VFAEDIESDFADIEGNAGGEAGIELEVGDADEMHDHAGKCCGASGGFAIFFDFAAPAFVATEFLAQDVDGGFPEIFFGGGVVEVAVIGDQDGEGFLGGCVVGKKLLGGGDLLWNYQIRLMLSMKPGMTSLQSIEAGDFNTSASCSCR
jgi:hypothetical protein